jgi:hypothetical protein
MPRINRCSFIRIVCTLVAVVIGWSAGASIGAAQFHLPKIPGIAKTKPDKPGSPEVKPSRGGTAEVVSMMSPDSAPPGGRGEVVMTGENFKDGMRIEFNCKGAQFSPDSIKVESPTRLVAQVTIPVKAEEGPCGTSMRSAPGKEPFRISNSANMPVAISVALLGEGDMQFMDMMMSMQKTLMGGFGNQGEAGRIVVQGDSNKYLKGNTTSFTESVSAVKSMGEMKQNGKPVGIFRIVFNDGKIYNFGGMGGGSDGHAAFEFLQRKLGK